jgi:hypothetical protein
VAIRQRVDSVHHQDLITESVEKDPVVADRRPAQIPTPGNRQARLRIQVVAGLSGRIAEVIRDRSAIKVHVDKYLRGRRLLAIGGKR